MFRRHFLRYRLYYCAHIPGLTNINPHDEPIPVEIEPQNGIERVVNLFQLDKNGEIKKEVASAIHISLASACAVGFYGGFKRSKTAFEDYIDANQTSRYISAYDFKRRIHDHVAVQFSKYFIIYGFKGLAFCGIFMLSLIIVAAFRDKDGILEFTTGGCLAGAFVRINNGLRGMAAGSFAGGLVATIGGALMWILSKITSTTLQDVRQWSYDAKLARKQMVLGAYKKQNEDTDLSRSMEYYTNTLLKPSTDEREVFILRNTEEVSAESNRENSSAPVPSES